MYFIECHVKALKKGLRTQGHKAQGVRRYCATKLQRRWREALRSRPTGGDFKPPQAAVVKSYGSEHCGKGAQDASGVNQEGEHKLTNVSVETPLQMESKLGTLTLPKISVGDT